MFNFKQIAIAIAIIVVTAIIVMAQGNVPNQTHFNGECSTRGEITVCITATEQ